MAHLAMLPQLLGAAMRAAGEDHPLQAAGGCVDADNWDART